MNIEEARQAEAAREMVAAAAHAEVDRQRRLRAAGQATRGDVLKAQRRHTAVLEELLQARAVVRRLSRETIRGDSGHDRPAT